VFKVNTDGTQDALIVCERAATQQQAQAFTVTTLTNSLAHSTPKSPVD